MNTISQASRLRRTDQRHIYRLMNQLQYSHIHLDWRDIDDWFESPDLRAWVVRRDNIACSMIGATVQPVAEPDQTYPIAWIRFMLPDAPFGDDPTLHELWQALRHDLKESGIRELAVLIIEPWVEPYFRQWGFQPLNTVISMRRSQPSITDYPPPEGFTLRQVHKSDIPAIARLDSRAFESVWQYSENTLDFAWGECFLFTMIEAGNRVLGYQMSTLEGTQGHLARLAVDPASQGNGLGKVLVGDAIAYMEEHADITSITVNTQGDNIRSKRLYERFGFRISAPDVEIWTVSLED